MDGTRDVARAVDEPPWAGEQLVHGQSLDVDPVGPLEGGFGRPAATDERDLVAGRTERGGLLFDPDVRREPLREEHADVHR
jgi:hypothetical protein